MKNKILGKILFAVFAVALCAAAYFAADLAFFQYDDPLERASLSIVIDGEDLSFTYENDDITLHGRKDVAVYALTTDGIAEVKDSYTESFPSNFLGSFAAVQTDGNVTQIAKTDMEYTQGYSASANLFLSEEVPFEVAYVDRDHFMVYFESKPLADTDITVTLADGNEKALSTDENGDLTELDLNDVRNGLRFTYNANHQTYMAHP